MAQARVLGYDGGQHGTATDQSGCSGLHHALSGNFPPRAEVQHMGANVQVSSGYMPRT